MRPIGLLLAFVIVLAGAYVWAQPVSAPSASPTAPAFAAATATASATAPSSPALTSTATPTSTATNPPPTASGIVTPAPSGTVVPSAPPGPAIPKAVIIVAPTDELTAGNLILGEEMAQKAEAAGMDVHRVFFPHAT